MAPTSAPTASAIGTAQTPATRSSPWFTPLGSVSQAAMPGASPTVDSSERSILPVSRISDSATTSSAIHAMVDSRSSNVARVRNAGYRMLPSTTIAMIGGTSAKSRSRAIAMRPAAGRAPLGVFSSPF